MTTRMKNTETGAVYDAPDSAVPMLVQSGWQEMSNKDVEALDRQALDEAASAEEAMRAYAAKAVAPTLSAKQVAAAEKAMRESAAQTLPGAPGETDESGAGRRDTAKKENG